MRDDDPPPLSRLKRALHTLRSPFRHGSPFHFASLKRTGSAKSSVSDSEIARDDRTMRKKNKKRADSTGAASLSTDSSPTVEKKKNNSLLKRMGSIGKRRGDSSTPTSLSEDPEPEMDRVPRRVVALSTDESQSSETRVKSESEVKSDADVKTNSENKTGLEIKSDPEITSDTVIKTEPEIKSDPEIKIEPEIKTESMSEHEVKIEPEIKTDPVNKIVSEMQMEPEINKSHINKSNPEIKMEFEIVTKSDPEIKMESEIITQPLSIIDLQLKTDLEIGTDKNTASETNSKSEILNTFEKQDNTSKSIESQPRSSTNELSISPEPPFTLAVEHPVAMRAFTKEAWKRRRKPEIVKPVEEPSPGNALKRRIAFVAQSSIALSSEDHDDDDDDDDEDEEEGGSDSPHTLEEAVALARQRLAMAAHSSAPPQSTENTEAEEEGCVTADAPDTMPAYGDLIEPEHKPESEDEASHSSPNAERREHLYKILVIGELGTGKTSIIKRYVHQFFSQHYRATIGVDFALKVLNWDANTVIRLQLWDIAGQERFGNMTRVYYKEAVGAFIVFDVSRVATFDAVIKWKNDLDTKVQLADGSPIPCILLANKCDQQKEGIVNSQAKMDEYCREKGFAGWFETSAKENINIEEAARSLVNKILQNDKLLQSNDRDGERFALDHKIANGENNRDASSSKSCAC